MSFDLPTKVSHGTIAATTHENKFFLIPGSWLLTPIFLGRCGAAYDNLNDYEGCMKGRRLGLLGGNII
jgi:hypothetical protein